MFGDIGWAELVLIGIVALIVIGPEDLPDMFRQLGRFTAKLRQMSREFSRAMEQAAKESGVKDVADDLKAVTSPKSLGLDKVKQAADRFEKWDPIKNAAKPTTPAKTLVPPSMPATPVAEVPEPVIVAVPEPAANTERGVVAPATPVAAASGVTGPQTQALKDKQAAKKAILAETAAKLKAVDTGVVETSVAEPTIAVPAKPVPKPRAPRKAKKAEEA